MEQETQKWIADFQEVLDRMPKEFWLYVPNGALWLMEYADTERGRRGVKPNGSIDDAYAIHEFTVPTEIDGGDW